MSPFRLKTYRLPHEGIIPGARGHRKVTVPAGTKVHCIVYGTKIYWCAYLDEAQALKCLHGLEATVDATSTQRRHIELDMLVAWNFKSVIPRRIARTPKCT